MKKHEKVIEELANWKEKCEDVTPTSICQKYINGMKNAGMSDDVITKFIMYANLIIDIKQTKRNTSIILFIEKIKRSIVYEEAKEQSRGFCFEILGYRDDIDNAKNLVGQSSLCVMKKLLNKPILNKRKIAKTLYNDLVNMFSSTQEPEVIDLFVDEINTVYKSYVEEYIRKYMKIFSVLNAYVSVVRYRGDKSLSISELHSLYDLSPARCIIDAESEILYHKRNAFGYKNEDLIDGIKILLKTLHESFQ